MEDLQDYRPLLWRGASRRSAVVAARVSAVGAEAIPQDVWVWAAVGPLG